MPKMISVLHENKHTNLKFLQVTPCGALLPVQALRCAFSPGSEHAFENSP